MSEQIAVPKSVLGKCPSCGAESLQYDDMELDSECLYYPCSCKCGWSGLEWHSITFIEYTSDDNSNPFDPISRIDKLAMPEITGHLADEDVRAGDVVQITDREHPWFPALMYVDEVKPWGIQACVLMPEGNAKGSHCSRAFNRLDWGKFERVGRAIIIEEGDAS